jgi:Flp pilus assembly pilin Flp
VAERTTTLAFILKDSASKGMRDLNKTARTLGKTASTLNAPFAAAAKGFAIAAGAAIAVGGAMFAAANAAAEEDASIARLNAAISANTTITEAQTKEMDAAVEARQKLAFSDDALRDSLSRLVPRTGDVTKALELQTIAMDFARLRGVDLSTASDLVGKVFGGNTGILSRYGFTVEKGTTATEALAIIQEAAAGQAEAYGETTQGAMESIQIALDNVVEDIGRVVLPILAEVLTFFRDEIMPRLRDFGIAFANAFTQAIEYLRPFITTMVTQVLPAIITVGGAIIGTLVKAFTEVGKFIGNHAGLVLTLVGAYTAFTVVINLAAAAARAKLAVMALLSLSVQSFGGPLVLAIALIAALVAGLIIAYNSSEDFRNIVDAIFDAIKPVLKILGDLFLMVGTTIVRAFGAAFDVVKKLVEILWGDGKGPLAIAVGAIGGLFGGLGDIIGFFIGLVQGALDIVQKLINLANNLPFVGGFLPRGGAGGPAKERQRALGGPVTGGQQYMVGERGPELFVPNQSGSIVPNNALGGQINVTVQAGAFLGSSDDAREFARRIYGALNDEARRRGTVLGGAR